MDDALSATILPTTETDSLMVGDFVKCELPMQEDLQTHLAEMDQALAALRVSPPEGTVASGAENLKGGDVAMASEAVPAAAATATSLTSPATTPRCGLGCTEDKEPAFALMEVDPTPATAAPSGSGRTWTRPIIVYTIGGPGGDSCQWR